MVAPNYTISKERFDAMHGNAIDLASDKERLQAELDSTFIVLMEQVRNIIRLENECSALKADAEKWRAYQARKQKAINAGLGKSPLRRGKPK